MEFKIYGSYPPYQNQKDAHELISQFNFQYNGEIIVIKSSRQIYGKTQFCIAELIRHCLNCENADCVFISPTYTQSLEQFKKITLSPLSQIIKNSDQQTLNILFTNGSRIRYFSSAQGQALRGITAKTLLIIDEAAFISDEVFNEIILPITIVHKPLMILTSTPYFRSGFFYKYFNSQDNNVIKLDWIFDYPENLEKHKEFLEQQKNIMPEMNFKTEYLGKWLDLDDGSLFKLDGNLIPTLSTKPTKYIGIDWGGGNGKDDTVLVGFDENFNQSLFYIDNELQPTQSVDKIVEVLKKHNNTNIIAENNSIGKIYIDMLRNKGINVRIFNTTNQTKRQIIEKLITYTQQDKIKLLNSVKIVEEFNKLKMEKTSSGLLTYNAKYGFKDDIVIAAALALHQGSSANYRVE